MIKLSKQQLEIVNSDAKKIIVDAGSGSGKTRVLTERVRRILNSGASPESVVVITFTNTAANELYNRLSDIPNIKKCFIGTIHSYANKLLKQTGLKFDIFSEYYQTQFMDYILKNPSLHYYCTMDDYIEFLKYDKLIAAGRMSQSDLRDKFSDYKVYDELMCLLGKTKTSMRNQMYKETVPTLCKSNNVITFDELIELATKYFSETKTSLDYLFVDELQDIGYLEYDFLIRLNAQNYFVIGDDFQSIFGFKGGDVNIFLSLMNNPDWTAYYLTENYRTSKSILMYANTIIKNAKDIIKKDVEYKNDNKGSLEFQSKALLEKFLKSLKSTDDWFLLTRTNKEMVMIDTILTKQNVDHYCFKQSTISQEKLKEIMGTPCIKVMTIHSAKGLECDNVALYGKLPVKGTGDSDELKVYYVGLTRAKNRCVVFV